MSSQPDEIDVASLDASFKQDPQRWVDSYSNHTATSLHQKAVAGIAQTNGSTSAK